MRLAGKPLTDALRLLAVYRSARARGIDDFVKLRRRRTVRAHEAPHANLVRAPGARHHFTLPFTTADSRAQAPFVQDASYLGAAAQAGVMLPSGGTRYIVTSSAFAARGARGCAQGCGTRDAFPGDSVCAPLASRTQAATDNSLMSQRLEIPL